MEYLKVGEALSVVLNALRVGGEEEIALECSLGRVLSAPIRANRDLPPYDVSAMDGFAVRSEDLAGGPCSLNIVEDIKAGDMPRVRVQQGCCSRIMTGAPVPEGADAVVRIEDTRPSSDTEVMINVAVKAGCDIRPRGENMQDGDVVLDAGVEITPGVIGVLATVKAASVRVYRHPRVAILSTGDELEAMNEPVDLNKIPDANSYALMAQVQALGITPVLLGIAKDEPAELERRLGLGLEYDVLLVSGGTSVGVHDYVRPTLARLGVDMKFWRVAMKPGHPLAFGVARRESSDVFVFGLPGNPVSSMVCFEEFVAPALRRMTGSPHLYRRTLTARLAHQLKIRPGRTEFVRVQLVQDDFGYLASSTGTQSSGVLLSMARADGLLVVPFDCSGYAAGDEVVVQLLDGTNFQAQIGYKE